MSVSPLRALLAVSLALAAGTAAAVAPVDRSPDGLWSGHAERIPATAVAVRSFRAVDLDLPLLAQRLARAPMEADMAAKSSPTVVTLPMPDGSYARFAVVSMLVMDPALAAKFPEIRTYRGQGLDDPAAVAQLDVTPLGFHAQVLAPSGRVLIDPATRGQTRVYASYFTRDAVPSEPFRCFFHDGRPGSYLVPPGSRPRPQAGSGTTLRQYRLALAATGEYSAAVCAPSPAAFACAFAQMTTAMNRVNGVYETEVDIRMNMVANENLIVYLSPADPYTNNDGATMLGENQTNIDSVIASANYDIGHVFSTGGGGIASLGVPCQGGLKARGVTGLSNPVGDAFYIDYVAHEMGHEWGANHPFNGTTTNCGGGNRNGPTAYEPGSGSTIMGYAGICGAEDLQPHSDPYFHTISFDEIVTYSQTGAGNGCATTSATGNGIPVPSAGGAFTIPKSTPFALTGSATDPNSDPLTYCWEEFDLGTAAPPNDNSDLNTRPILRSFNPTTSPSRTFPKLSDILAGTSTFGEALPSIAQTMTFRMTARDNKAGGGGVNHASTTVTVDGVSGPFTVTGPTGAAVWNGGSTQTVTWNVAGTTAAPVSCANVKISLSSDGGSTFPDVLLASTPNDGTQSVTVPTGITSSSGRVKVECATGNIFFNVNSGNFTLNPTPVGLQRFAGE